MEFPLQMQSMHWNQTAGTRTPPRVKLKRAPVACNRCRRLRSKCVHQGARPPCESCAGAGPAVASECIFFMRGMGNNDRNIRHRKPRQASSESSSAANSVTTQTRPSTSNLEQSDLDAVVSTALVTTALTAESAKDPLPPQAEVIEGCRTFITSYYQIGFIPKALFLERLNKPLQSKDRFFFYSILSISARFTPSLVRRYGGGLKATRLFIEIATRYGMEETFKPTVENIQAFYLLGLAEWGSGDRNRSAIHMGIAVKMATILQLHREETFQLPSDSPSDTVIEAEVARRTFWVIQGQENLHSGQNVPKSFCPDDITALLPCEEDDFSFGSLAAGRAALDGTPPALKDPALVSSPSRSLSAALIQVQNLWGRVARGAHLSDGEIHQEPWEANSYYSELSRALRVWGDNLAPKHRWSIWNFRGYKTKGLHLGYLSLVMVFRLCNIVLRRFYLKSIIKSITESNDESGAPPRYWEDVSQELFINVFELHEQITTFITTRSQEEGFPTEIVFCVYICGSLAAYLKEWPQLYPSLAASAESVLRQSLDVLKQLHYDWPMSQHWGNALSTMTTTLSAGGSSPHSTSMSWANEPSVPVDRSVNESQVTAEDDARKTSSTPIETANFEHNMQEMEGAELGADHDALSMLSTNDMGFCQFDAFEPDLLIALANGDAQIWTGIADEVSG